MRHHATLACLSGLLILSAPTAAAGYTSETLGTRLDSPRDLVVEDFRVQAETPLGGDRVLMEVTADVRNTDSGTWNGVEISLDPAAAGVPLVWPLSHMEFAPEIAAGALVAGPGSVFTEVAAADVATARAEILAGTALLAYGTNPAGTVILGPPELVLENIRILGETTLASGRVLIEASADLRNNDTATWTRPTLGLDRTAASVDFGQPPAVIPVTNLAPSATAAGPGTLYFTVASADVPAARAAVLAGTGWDHAATELWVFSAPPRGIDEVTEDAWQAPAQIPAVGKYTLVFESPGPLLDSLQPGDLLVEDPGVHRLTPPPYDNPFSSTDDHPAKVLADYLPFEIESTSVVDGKVHVTGRKRILLEVLESATFFQDSASNAYEKPVRPPYDPPVENTYTQAELEDRHELAAFIAETDPRDGRLADLLGMNATPWHFNKLRLSPKITVTGEILLRSSGLQLEIKIRDFQLQRAVSHIDAGVVMNLVVECEGAEDTSLLPDEEKSAHLFDIAFPAVTFNLGGVPVQIAPLFYLDAGVEADAPQSFTLPVQSAYTIGMDLGYDRSRVTAGDDGFFYEPVTEFIPFRVSDPTVFDELAVSAGVWTEMGVGIVGSIAPLGVGQRGILNLGPSLAVRATTDFTVAPLADPWWALDFDIDLNGNFAMDILGESLVDNDIPIHHFELAEFDRDAGGPLVGSLAREAPANSGITPLSAETVRWGRMFPPSPSFGTFDRGFLAPLPPFGPAEDGWEFIAAGANVSRSAIARFTTDGDLLWMKDLGINPLARCGAALPDGSFITAGNKGLDFVVAEFDGAGERQWITSLRPDLSLTLTEVCIGENGAGEPEILVAGHVHHGTVSSSDPAVIKLDAGGNVLWAHYYALDGDDEPNGMTLTAAGDILLSGYTAADVPPPAIGTPKSDNVLKDATSNALLMKIDPADGTLLWATAYAGRWAMNLEEVLEAPDGTIYAAGAASRIVTQTRPVNLFAKFEADGTLLDHVCVGDDPDWPDELPNGGNTPYDLVSGLVWADGGLWACGTTGLGAGRAGFLMALTDELGVKFYSIFDGPDAEVSLDLADAGDGMAVLATTRSAYPWADGGKAAPFVLKQPWEGIMRFHEDSQLTSLVLQPQVHHSSPTLEFQMLSTQEGANGTQTFGNSSGSVPFVRHPLTFTPGSSVPAPTDATDRELLALEMQEPALIDSYAGWTNYHHLTGPAAATDADDDDDGLANLLEAFFGRSPHVAETTAPVEISGSGADAVLEFQRASFAPALGVTLTASEDLVSWTEATDFTEFTETLSPSLDRVQLVFPQDLPRRFFRFEGAP